MMHVLYGAKGGVGATTLACALAAALDDAALVDLDLVNGDLYGALELPAATTLADVLADVDGLAGDALRRRLPRHASGLHVLSQAGRLDQLDRIAWPAVAELLPRLEATFEHVVVDGVRDPGDVALAALDGARTIVLVTTPELAAVRATRRARLVLRQIGVGDDRLALVVNRQRRRAPVPLAAIVESVELGRPIVVRDRATLGPRDLAPLVERLTAGDRTQLIALPRRWRRWLRRAEAT